MLKNNLKLNDTFLVTVEIITSDAIIVSANLNSVIFRGTLIRCKKNSPCSFKKLPDNQSSFSATRLDLKNLKRQIRFKTFKSTYNLRRTNNKIIKAKQKINTKSDLTKDGKKLFNSKPLSIKLKKDNGVYINATSSLSANCLAIDTGMNSKSTLSIDKKRTANIIKIVKTKMHTNEYRYSIINSHKTDEDNNDIVDHSQSKILKLCITPIPDAMLPPYSSSDSSKSDSSPNDSSSCSLFDNPSPVKVEKCDPTSIIDIAPVIEPLPSLTLSSLPFSLLSSSSSSPKLDIKIEPTLNSTIEADSRQQMSPTVTTTVATTPVDNDNSLVSSNTSTSGSSGSFTKLKIVKNGSKPNSYVIKSGPTSDQSATSATAATTTTPTTTTAATAVFHSRRRYNCKHFRIGDIVWAKLSGYSIWPAKVIDFHPDADYVTVMWLGDDYRTSQLVRYKLWDFGAHFHEKFNKKGKGNYLNAVQQAQSEYAKIADPLRDCCDDAGHQNRNNHNTAPAANTNTNAQGHVNANNVGWLFDISSEESRSLESVPIDDASCELERLFSSSSAASSLQESRPNIYLPLPDEEFELMRSCSKSAMSDFLSFDSPDSQGRPLLFGVDDDNNSSSTTSHTNHSNVVDHRNRPPLSQRVPFTAKFHLNSNDIIDYNLI